VGQVFAHKVLFYVISAFCPLLITPPQASSWGGGIDRSGAFQPHEHGVVALAFHPGQDKPLSLSGDESLKAELRSHELLPGMGEGRFRSSLLRKGLQEKRSEKKGQPFGAKVTQTSREKKSVRKAVLLSLILPGSGELYAGEKESARLFLVTETLIWSLHFAFKTYGDWRRDDYRLFSVVHAGADPGLNSEKYFDDLKFYSSGDRYNRLAFLENGPQAELYPEDALWEWDSEEAQRRYRSLRNSSLLSYRYADYAIAGAVINRIVSAIHAARAARKTEARKQEIEEPGDFCLRLQSRGLEWRLSLTMNF